jgi:sugar O-acyltransferase (sialic acid O-acetyltransferase NeuD family)
MNEKTKNSNTLTIAGSGNLGKHILDELLLDDKYNKILFFDEYTDSQFVYEKYPIIKLSNELNKLLLHNPNFICAVGNPRKREKLTDNLISSGGNLISIISSRAIISPHATIAAGCFVQSFVGISHESFLGRSCIIHSGTTISHQIKIGNFVSVGPNVSIIGGVEINDFSFIGANAVILPNVKIGKNVIIGAGKVVRSDVKDYETLI